MSCCKNPQNTISNSVNIGVDPRTIKNNSCIRINIPLRLCNTLKIYGNVINNCTGSSIPYANVQLLEQNPCTGCYRCISTTTSNHQGMYQFNLNINRFSNKCSNYKIVASIPVSYPIMPRVSSSSITMNCPQQGSTYNNFKPYEYINNFDSNSCSNYYPVNTSYYDESESQKCQSQEQSQNVYYNNSYGNSCCNSQSCNNVAGDFNVQELQDDCPNQRCGYTQNTCQNSQQGNCYSGTCDISNFWND